VSTAGLPLNDKSGLNHFIGSDGLPNIQYITPIDGGQRPDDEVVLAGSDDGAVQKTPGSAGFRVAVGEVEQESDVPGLGREAALSTQAVSGGASTMTRPARRGASDGLLDEPLLEAHQRRCAAAASPCGTSSGRAWRWCPLVRIREHAEVVELDVLDERLERFELLAVSPGTRR